MQVSEIKTQLLSSLDKLQVIEVKIIESLKDINHILDREVKEKLHLDSSSSS